MHELLLILVEWVLVGPLQSHLAAVLAAAGVPEAVGREALGCTARLAPAIAERFAADPW